MLSCCSHHQCISFCEQPTREAVFWREGRALCTSRMCRGSGGGRETLLFDARNPVICRGITRWEWKRMGADEKTLFSLCPSWKAKPIFFFFYVIVLTQRAWIPWQRWQAQIHQSCSRDGHTKLCSSSDDPQAPGPLIKESKSCFACSLHLKFILLE